MSSPFVPSDRMDSLLPNEIWATFDAGIKTPKASVMMKTKTALFMYRDIEFFRLFPNSHVNLTKFSKNIFSHLILVTLSLKKVYLLIN